MTGDLVLAEPAGARLATALAERIGVSVESHRRPADLASLLDDLKTYSLFGAGKVLLVVDSAVLADREAAATLVADALEGGSPGEGGLAPSQREAASRLLQALHLFGIDPALRAPGQVVEQLPDWALAGRKRGRLGSRQAEERRRQLTELLEAARAEGLQGVGEESLARLGDAVRRGLPKGHALVLVEGAVATDHPLVENLDQRDALLSVGRVVAERRGGWQGIDRLARQMEAEVGVSIRPDALKALAERTLRQEEGRDADARGDSTARFAGEYRKLAEMASGSVIERALVEANVEDRGEQDVWAVLDAVGEGEVGEALDRVERMFAGADDADRARFGFFSLLASFCRQLVAVRGLVERLGLPADERNYSRFKSRIAPKLSEALPEGLANPLGRLHPFRLHRAYLAAGRLSPDVARLLPWRVLETERALKGESADSRAALATLISELGRRR